MGYIKFPRRLRFDECTSSRLPLFFSVYIDMCPINIQCLQLLKYIIGVPKILSFGLWGLRSLIRASLPPTILAYLKFFTLLDNEVGFEKCSSPPIILLSVYVVNIIGQHVPTQESMAWIIAILYGCTKNSLLDSEVCDKSICPTNLQCLQLL